MGTVRVPSPFTEAQVEAAARAIAIAYHVQNYTPPLLHRSTPPHEPCSACFSDARAALTAASQPAPEPDDNQVVPTPSQLMAQNDSLRGKVAAAEGVVGAAREVGAFHRSYQLTLGALNETSHDGDTELEAWTRAVGHAKADLEYAHTELTEALARLDEEQG